MKRNEMTDDPWSVLRPLWRGEEPGTTGAAIAQVRRAERARIVSRAIRAVVALVAVGGLAAAVSHAANPREAALAFVVGLTIAVAWLGWALSDRRQADLLSEPPTPQEIAQL